MESTNIRRMTFPRTVTLGLIAGLMVAFVVATSHAQPSASSADEQTKSRLEQTWPNDDAPQSVRVTVLEQARQRAVALSNELPQAQGPSRAALLEAERQARADSVVAPTRSTVEKGLHAFAEEVNGIVGTGLELTFENAAIRVGAAQQGATYRVRWSALDNFQARRHPRAAGCRRRLKHGRPSRKRRGVPQTMWATGMPSPPFALSTQISALGGTGCGVAPGPCRRGERGGHREAAQ